MRNWINIITESQEFPWISRNGEPLTVFHGTRQAWEEPLNSGETYFSDTREEAKSYGHHVYAANIWMKKPYITDDYDFFAEAVHVIPELKEKGYDGIIFNDRQYVVFSPSQMKLLASDEPGINLVEGSEVTVKHSDGKDTIRFIDSSGNSDLWKSKRIRYLNSSEALHEHHIMLLDGDKIIGMTGLQVNPYNPKELWIKFVSVDPDYQGRGYGRKLVEMIYDYAREKGLKPKSSSFTDQGEQRLKHIHAELNEDAQVDQSC